MSDINTPNGKPTKKTWNEMTKKEKRTGIITLVVIFIIVASFINSLTGKNSNTTNTEAKTSTQQTADKPTQTNTTTQTTAVKPKYDIVHSTTNDRFDDKYAYYVVIDKVDTTKDAFKQNTKDIVADIAKEKGTKDFTVTIYDDASVAADGYNRVITTGAEAIANKSQHVVAMYSGGISMETAEVSTADDAYEISYYPAAFTDTPTVGQYVSNVQFKP